MPRKSRKNVGLIGLGIIGTRVAQGLRAAGFQVFVWNRTPKPAPNFLGSVEEIAEICDVIQLFVADSQALFEVLDSFGDSLKANHVVICSATVGPEATLEAARIVEGKGARFLDAPFTGSRLAVEKRQLVYYVGGDDTTFKKAEPILKATSKLIIRCGEIGHAAVLKVVTNMITAVTTQTLAEALAIVKKSGLEPEIFATALESNACRSGTTDIKLPKMIAGDYEPHFSLKHMFKDVQLAIHMANSLDIEVPATTVTAGVLYGALNNGWADLDFASIFKLYDGTSTGAEPADLARSIAPPASEPAQIEAPREMSSSAPAQEPAGAPNTEFVAPESRRTQGTDVELRPVEPSAQPAAPMVEQESDVKPMEIVADVPKGAKSKGEVGGEPKADEARSGDAATADENRARAIKEGAENGEEKASKPFNRIKRFFFSPTGK